MDAGTWALLIFAAAAAAGDWVAVARRQRRLEYTCKPLALLLLVGVALTLDPSDPDVRRWFVIALVLSLIGDVLLMVPPDLFIGGLAAFFLAHVAYVIGLWTDGVEVLPVAIGLALAALAVMLVGGRILDAVRGNEETAGMAVPVGAYMAMISVMLASAIGTREVLAIGGAALFYTSDALIAWSRFIRRQGWMPVTIMVTYHLAQGGLVLSLLE